MPWTTACWITAVVACTLLASVWDLRCRRVPNWLTFPMFFGGLLFQAVCFGWAGLGDGLGGFAVGFFPLFILWLTGGGGAGDAKLMGSLGVWLGFTATAQILILSAGLLLCGLMAFRIQQALAGRRSTLPLDRKRPLPVPYAVPVALATWLTLLVERPGPLA